MTSKNTLTRQLAAGIITQERYDRILDIIEHDDADATKQNTAYIDILIIAGLKANREDFNAR